MRPVVVPRSLTSTEAADRVLGDPNALHLVVLGITRRARNQQLDPLVRSAVAELARTLHPHEAGHRLSHSHILDMLAAEPK